MPLFFQLFVLKQVLLDFLLLNPLFGFGLGLSFYLRLLSLGLAVFEDVSEPSLSLLLGNRAKDGPVLFASSVVLVQERLQGLILVNWRVQCSQRLDGSAGSEEVAQVLGHVLLSLLAARHEALHAAELKLT